jgi:hypothetical protein
MSNLSCMCEKTDPFPPQTEVPTRHHDENGKKEENPLHSFLAKSGHCGEMSPVGCIELHELEELLTNCSPPRQGVDTSKGGGRLITVDAL